MGWLIGKGKSYIKRMDFNRGKFKDLVHYVIWKYPDGHPLGCTKINKLVWLSDVRFYMEYRRSITGATYRREEGGPAAIGLREILQELEAQGTSNFQIKTDYIGNDYIRYVSTKKPDTSIFNPEEIEIINYCLGYYSDYEHSQSSRMMDEQELDYGWKVAEIGETIPMHAAFAARLRSPNEEELGWARGEIERLKLA